MNPDFERLIDGLGARRDGASWKAHCPCHDDKNGSLDLAEKNGKVLVKCFAGCDQKAVVSALRDRGLWPKRDSSNGGGPVDLSGGPILPSGVWRRIKDSGHTYACHWTYHDPSGAVIGHHVRYEKPGSKKETRPFFKRDASGKWKCGAASVPRPLYGLDRLVKNPGASIVVTEGEKAADAAQQLMLSFVAVTSWGGMSGAKKADWSPLKGRSVYVWPDNDEAGQKYAADVAQQLRKAGASFLGLIDVEALGMPEKGDAADWPRGQPLPEPLPVIPPEQMNNSKRKDRATKPEAPTAASEFFRCTDMGNAERFRAQHGGVVRYCHQWDKWLIWDGVRWKMDGTCKVTSLAKRVVRSIYGEAEACNDKDMREAIASWAHKSEKRSAIEAILGLAKSEPGIPVEPHQLDSDNWLLNATSGTIDLRTGEHRPNNPADLITKVVQVTCDPSMTCPNWDAFLNRIMESNAALIGFLQRAIGYSLTGDTSEQCLFLCYGTGANGKSTFLDTIKSLFNDYARQAEFSTFLVQKNEGVRNDIADLKGARFVSAVEAECGQRLAESVVKQMTGGDTIKARFLFKEFFEFQPGFKLWLAANSKPTIRGNDHAIWRRIRLIPFTVTIPESERDPKLKDRLKQELPGILNWALIGCAEWQEHGLGMPDEVRAATDAYRDEMDILSEFIADCCLVDVRCTVPKSELYERYEEWSKRNGEEPLTKRTFRARLLERGVSEERDLKARKWRGIGLLERSRGEHDT